MKFDPTEQQKQAINSSSGALVSAAAGSGKTAVLVERIISKICDEKNGIPADKLLVVTFTKAAAKEMQVRIEKRLNEVCRENPDSKRLREQKIKIKNAKICTIDSFCIDLIKENFDRIGISPDFSVGDNNVLSSLSKQAMDETLNMAYESDDEDFKLLLEALSGDFNDYIIRENIETLWFRNENMAFPREYLLELIDKSLDESLFDKAVCYLIDSLREKLEIQVKKLSSMAQLLSKYEETEKKYLPAFKSDIESYILIIEACKKYNYDDVYNLLKNLTHESLINISKNFEDKKFSESAKSVRNKAKDICNAQKGIFDCDFATLKAEFLYGSRVTNALLKLTLSYYDNYLNLRREKNILTFSDTEHEALNLVCEYKNGEIVKKESAKDIINRYEEVLVDEFQDTNNMQNTLFSILSDSQKRIFAVGDVKQSIYRFRGANPDNFLKMKEDYIPYDIASKDDNKKIILSSNFRSRKGICDFVNFIFKIAMNGKYSSIKYNNEEVLNFNANYYPDNSETEVEIGFVDVESGYDSKECDAANIAEYILKTKQEGYVTDKNGETLRKVEFSDFVVLLRSASDIGNIYKDVLESAGIPVSYHRDNFLKRSEVNILLSLLSVIENQTRDIELVSVLMSPIFSFTADELAEIRLLNRKSNMFSALVLSAENGNEKSENAVRLIRHFKTCFISMSLSELITEIFNETDMLNIMGILENGDTRRKNLILLQNFADSYENNGFSKNISAFKDYINQISDNISSASSVESNAVRIMTIHESKGLQFPICIIGNTSAAFNTSDSRASLLIDETFGAALRFNSDNYSHKRPYITLKAILENSIYQQIDEELRLLYVALTRAQEKLFISVSSSKSDKFLNDYSAFISNCETLEDYLEYAPKFSSYADIIKYAVAVHPDICFKRDADGSSGFTEQTESKIKITFKNAAEIILPVMNQELAEDDFNIDNAVSDEIEKAVNFEYPYKDIRNIESKAAAAIIAHKAEIKDFSFSSKPGFMLKNGLTPANRGTAIHRFMQFCDFNNAEKDILSEANRLFEYEYITYRELKGIDFNLVSQFFKSNLYMRIKNANRVEREMRFLTEVSAKDINDNLPSSVENEKVVIQGSVDCVFIENGEIVIVDFKTDRVKDMKDLVDTYAIQLDIYAKACSNIFEKKIKEKIIYSFYLGKDISF